MNSIDCEILFQRKGKCRVKYLGSSSTHFHSLHQSVTIYFPVPVEKNEWHLPKKKRRWRKTKYINKMEWQDWNWNSECSARATVCLCQTLAHTSAFPTGISFMFIVHCPMSTQSAVRNGFSFFDFVLCWTASVDRWKCITKLKSQDTWPAYKCV